MKSNCIDISSPLFVIAKDIGDKYLLRPFPSKTLKNQLLDYTEIRNAPLKKNWLFRPIHGYQNACRVAALIPILFEFYNRHQAEFPFHLQEEIKRANPRFD